MADTNSNGTRAPDDSDTNTARQGKVKRGKTRDAFAFRDFDKGRILKRCIDSPITEFYLSDDEIINHTCDCQKIIKSGIAEVAETKFEIALAFLLDLRRYYIKITRHITRLEKISRRLADKALDVAEINQKCREQYQRAKRLIKKYWTISEAIVVLGKKLSANCKKVDKEIAALCRKEFASRLKMARISREYSQGYIADRLGLTVGAYQFYERGQREPSLTNLVRISKLLDVTPNWLILGWNPDEDEPPPPPDIEE